MDNDPDTMLGLYNKYRVQYRADYQEDTEDLALCDLFVLDLTHDPYAAETLGEWRRSWDRANPYLPAPDQNYIVTRNNDPTGKHAKCQFWVLNATQDTHSRDALRVYVNLCRETYPGLAADLTQMIRRNTVGEVQA